MSASPSGRFLKPSRKGHLTNVYSEQFKWSLLFSLTAIVVMIVLAVAPSIPWWWRITDFVAILPMATVAVSHLLLPLALNPALMEFSF